ncbi:MAG: ComEC/Rec2 family competence protein [Spirochaetaceae bacterium]|jgi:competence protein ComEC|nr:ComEC/Rec2 family competence protein [Spirochaetaceae bacterium]
MNKLVDKLSAVLLAIKFPFFAFAGATGTYYGFAPDYMARAILPFTLFIIATLSFLRVLDLLPRLSIAERTAPANLRVRKASYIAAVFFAAGSALGIAGRCSANRASLVFAGLEPEKIIAISGKLLDDPRNTASGRGMALLKLRDSRGKGGICASARGNILVFFPENSIPRLKEFGRGCEIYIEGTFAKTDGSSFFSKTPLFRAKSVHITRPATRFDQWRTGIRLALIKAFSPDNSKNDWGGLALALLLGIRDNLDSELSKQYGNAGCSYILALSGMHLAIVSSIIAFFLKKPLGLKAAAIVGIFFILLYVFLVGAQPSLTRAAIMYILGATAIVCALPVNPALLLGYSFMIQILAQPASGDSISFILSYLALAGILSLGQGTARLLRGYVPEFLASPLSASIGAFLATASVCTLFFGLLQFVGIIAGLIMVPLTTVFMIGSMAYIPVCFVIPGLAAFIGKILEIIYSTLEKIVTIAGYFPPLLLPNVSFSVTISIILPIVLIFVCKIIHKKRMHLEKFT